MSHHLLFTTNMVCARSFQDHIETFPYSVLNISLVPVKVLFSFRSLSPLTISLNSFRFKIISFICFISVTNPFHRCPTFFLFHFSLISFYFSRLFMTSFLFIAGRCCVSWNCGTQQYKIPNLYLRRLLSKHSNIAWTSTYSLRIKNLWTDLVRSYHAVNSQKYLTFCMARKRRFKSLQQANVSIFSDLWWFVLTSWGTASF